MTTRVTRNDVARRAGTSTAVVSYVVNGGPRPVAPATRARVEAAIEELGYRPDLMARALRAERSNTIGMVVPDSSQAYFSELVHGVERAAYARGSLVLLGNAEFSTEQERRYLDTLMGMRVDGILVARAEVRRSAGNPPPSAVSGQVPVVYLNNRAPRGVEATSITLANSAGARMLADHLIGHGYSRIDCLTGTARSGAVSQRTQGWRQAMDAAGLTGRVLRTSLDRRRARDVITDWLDDADRPQAVAATADGLALDVISAAHTLGLRVPQDLAVVGFGGTQAAARSWPTLTTAGHSFEHLGQIAVDALQHTDRRDRDSDIVIDVDMIPGESCGCHT